MDAGKPEDAWSRNKFPLRFPGPVPTPFTGFAGRHLVSMFTCPSPSVLAVDQELAMHHRTRSADSVTGSRSCSPARPAAPHQESRIASWDGEENPRSTVSVKSGLAPCTPQCKTLKCGFRKPMMRGTNQENGSKRHAWKRPCMDNRGSSGGHCLGDLDRFSVVGRGDSGVPRPRTIDSPGA